MGKPHQSDHIAETAEGAEKLGSLLRRARETQQFSIATAAATLHLPPRVITALEEDDFKQFEPVYVRGYLRNYARLLELKADPLIESYNQTLTQDLPPAPVLNQNQAPQPVRKRGYLLLLAVGLPLFLWVASKAFQTPEEEHKTRSDISVSALSAHPSAEATAPPPLMLPGQVQAATPSPELPAQAAKTPENPAPAPQPVKAEPATSVAAPALAEPSSQGPATPPVPPQAAATANPAPPTQPIGQGPDNIAFHLSSSAWVSIRDQSGQRLAYENFPAGTLRSYQGRAPFAVVLGNYTPANKIEFNGQPYDPKAKTGTVARFSVGQPKP